MSQLENKDLEAQVSWMRQEPPYAKMTMQDIQQENRRVLIALKILEGRLDKELYLQKHARIGQGTQEHQADQLKVVLQSIKNNQQCIKVLEKDLKNLKDRREELTSGLQSKLNIRKHELEKKIGEYKAELRKMKLQQNEVNKKLSTHNNPIEPQSFSEHARLQQQLRIFSLKYMKILQKHNRVTEQVALATSSSPPELHIPEQLFDKDLEERQEAQFKEYQGIVKMCTILSKRNDSESNKFNRLYTQKLKELEKTIVNLGQLDRMIALKEGEIIQGKKNLELIKFRATTGERGEQMLSVSQSQLRRASYSTSHLPQENKFTSHREFSQGVVLPKNIAKRP